MLYLHQICRHGFASQFAIDLSRPTHYVDAEGGAPAQAIDQSLGALARAQHVHPLAHERLFHHPAVSPAPARQHDDEDDDSRESRTTSQHEFGETEGPLRRGRELRIQLPAGCEKLVPNSYRGWRSRRGLANGTAAARPP